MNKVMGVNLLPCENPDCKWSTTERFIPISRLTVTRMASAYMMPTFVCECTYLLRTETIRS